jgi:retron-type reverse transcriptase
MVQYKILTQVLNKIEVPEYIHAFEKGKSIPQMAVSHVGKDMVVSIDLEDFFTSIKQYQVFDLFQHIGFGEKSARTLSELCTYDSFVPQGALTSPKLSNIITALTFGPAIKDYCDKMGFTLTIYADDITVSMDQETRIKHGKGVVKNLCKVVAREVGRYRFRINTAKTKVMRYFQRQYVCGAVVNVKVNLQKSERNKLRAMVYNCNKNGIEAEAEKAGISAELFYSKLMGRLNWFSQLNPTAGDRLKSKLKKADMGKQESDPIADGGNVKELMSLDSGAPTGKHQTASENPVQFY